MKRKKKGKLIVIDGTDGAGKATQTGILAKRLKKEGYKVAVEDFPRYGKNSAYFVEQYLNGKFGTAKNLGSYVPSIFYAIDRFEASVGIKEKLNKSYIIISNRYVTANMGHQGGKIKNARTRADFFRWLFDLEYKVFNIPLPDLNLILHMPPKISQKLVDKKGSRKYVGGKKRDLHEKDLSHLKDAGRTYLELAKSFGYPIIRCYRNNSILTREKISGLVWAEVKKII